MRRSFCKSWRDDKWRDLLLAFWYWLAEGAAFVDVSMGEGAALRLALPPMSFEADFGIDSPDDNLDVPDDEDESSTPEEDVRDEGSNDEPEDLDEDE